MEALSNIKNASSSQSRGHLELGNFIKELSRFLKGKDSVVDATVAAILAGGHILLEDVPGVGKTTVIKAIARLLGCSMKRVQCTNDLLPSDIIGVEAYNSETQEFVFHKGPIFSNLLFVDELNRASPRTQSALLEAMGEGYVSVDRKTYELPKPFIVFSAQNPSDHVGTYPLPESQLDRFSIKLHLDYPSSEKEKEIFMLASQNPLESLPEGILDAEKLLNIQKDVESVHVSERVAHYVKQYVDASRKHPELHLGISTRGGVIWVRLARARAYLKNRDYVIPDDLIELAPFCLSHRLVCHSGIDPRLILEQIQQSISVES